MIAWVIVVDFTLPPPPISPPRNPAIPKDDPQTIPSARFACVPQALRMMFSGHKVAKTEERYNWIDRENVAPMTDALAKVELLRQHEKA